MSKSSATGEWKVIRDPEFSRRITIACDNSPHCPDFNFGRMAWIQAEMKKRGHTVSRESVKRWIHGENRPRQSKSDVLADILGVDRMWLFAGVEDRFTARERRAFLAEASGAVNLVAALIQMDGGAVAFPAEDDPRSKGDAVDFYAIIKGVNYPVRVAVGHVEDGEVQFHVPPQFENLTVIGVLRDGMSFTLVELKTEWLEAGDTKGEWLDVHLPESTVASNAIPDFTRRL